MIYSDCSYITQTHLFNMIIFPLALFFGFQYASESDSVFLTDHKLQNKSNFVSFGLVLFVQNGTK
jgi:hypothetical protein